MLCINPLEKIVGLMLLLLFAFVFISDWRTWLPNFYNRKRIK